MSCRVCGKQLSNPEQIAKGIGSECERRLKSVDGSISKLMKVSLDSISNGTRYYITKYGNDKVCVKVWDVTDKDRFAKCFRDGETRCSHIRAVATVDRAKFETALIKEQI